MGEEAFNFSKEMAANIPGERRVHKGFRVRRSARDFDASGISPCSGSQDQHTMVLTSNGPRDQRMELSVRTAVMFYFVQDMLGFDQPSEAVEWLIEKAEDAIRELPQPASISTSHRSQYVDSNITAVASSCVQTGDLNSSSQENTFSDSEDRRGNRHDEILAARTSIGQKLSTAKTTESNSIDSIGHGERREQRSVAMRSVASNRRTRERANAVPPKEIRAKARERARERAKQKDKSYSQQSEICGILQPSSVSPWSPTFCLQENTSFASSLNMINENTDGNSNSSAFLNSLMITKDSILDSQSTLCLWPPPTEIQCSSLASIHYYTPQQEGTSFQSTEAPSVLDSGTFHLPSGTFPEAVATTSSSQGLFCTYPLDHAPFQSFNLCRCCKIHSIETPCINGALETLYGSQSSWDNVFLQFK